VPRYSGVARLRENRRSDGQVGPNQKLHGRLPRGGPEIDDPAGTVAARTCFLWLIGGRIEAIREYQWAVNAKNSIVFSFVLIQVSITQRRMKMRTNRQRKTEKRTLTTILTVPEPLLNGRKTRVGKTPQGGCLGCYSSWSACNLPAFVDFCLRTRVVLI